MTRLEQLLHAIAGTGSAPIYPDWPCTSDERYLYAILNGSTDVPKPLTRRQEYLFKRATGSGTAPAPVTHEEMFWSAFCGDSDAPACALTSLEAAIAEACAPPSPEPPVLLSFEHVLWSIANNSYTTDYSVGDLIPLDLGTEGNINMQIVAFDADDKADGTGKAHISFVSEKLLATSHRMNPARTPSSAPYDEGTGAIGGWEKSEMRSYLKTTIKPLIPEYVRNSIMEVTKYTYIYNADGTVVDNSATTDDVWIPSYREIFGGTVREPNGEYYNGVFNSSGAIKKMKVNGTSATNWWLRSADSTTDFRRVTNSGANNFSTSSNKFFPAIGFCL